MYALALIFLVPSLVAIVAIAVWRRPLEQRFGSVTLAISGLFIASLLLPRNAETNIAAACVFPCVESSLILAACGLLAAGRVLPNAGTLRYFALLTMYYLLTFAGAYHQFGTTDGKAPFIVQGSHRALSRADSVYFALVTASTAGFEDITPNVSLARAVVSLQLMTGFLLFSCLLVRMLELVRAGYRPTGHDGA